MSWHIAFIRGPIRPWRLDGPLVELEQWSRIQRGLTAQVSGEPPGSWFDFLKPYEVGEWRTEPEAKGDDEGGVYSFPLYDEGSGGSRPSRSPRRLRGLPPATIVQETVVCGAHA